MLSIKSDFDYNRDWVSIGHVKYLMVCGVIDMKEHGEFLGNPQVCSTH